MRKERYRHPDDRWPRAVTYSSGAAAVDGSARSAPRARKVSSHVPDRLLRDQLQSTLSGAYTIDRELGGGGMSRVFLAHEERLGRTVVLKVLTPELAAGVSASRFEREIRLAAALQHANIVPLLSAGETNGLPFYTMPFVEGLSLRARLARDGTLPIADVVSVLRDVTRALAYAHEHGVVHRDIKPENILLSGDAAVVTDFGIAKALTAARGGAERPGTLTEIGTSLGTPAYMSPEQASGDPGTDHRTDFYALGCVAYEMLTGAPPFAGRPLHQLFAAHMTETPRPISATRGDCPPPLAALVMRCLEKDPARRPQSAREILQALGTLATPALLHRATPATKRWAIVAGAATVLIVAAALAYEFASGSRADIRSIAVLPFDNVGGDSTQEYFSDGIADEVSSALAQVPGIRVAARSSANMFKGKDPDPRDVGAKLRVGGVVEGSVRRLGRAAEKDPAFAEPYVGIAHAYAQLADVYLKPGDAYPKALDAVRHAIVLDSTLAAAHSVLGVLLQQYSWDWAAAKREVDRALALNPSDPIANQADAFGHWVMRDSVDGLAGFQRYVRLDPRNAFAHQFMSQGYSLVGMDDSAISEYRQSKEVQPGFLYGEPLVDQSYRHKGMLAQALALNDSATRTRGRPTTGLVLTLVALGRRDEAVRRLRELEASVAAGTYEPPELIARCYAALGDTVRALAYLKEGVDAHSAFAPMATWYPELRWARNDPRYAPLKAKMHLE